MFLIGEAPQGRRQAKLLTDEEETPESPSNQYSIEVRRSEVRRSEFDVFTKAIKVGIEVRKSRKTMTTLESLPNFVPLELPEEDTSDEGGKHAIERVDREAVSGQVPAPFDLALARMPPAPVRAPDPGTPTRPPVPDPDGGTRMPPARMPPMRKTLESEGRRAYEARLHRRDQEKEKVGLDTTVSFGTIGDSPWPSPSGTQTDAKNAPTTPGGQNSPKKAPSLPSPLRSP